MALRSALWLPIFDELADPVLVARLAAEAEESGWHGVFVWDHIRWREPVRQVADPWITLSAIAVATERVRLGPMITPLARRRPAKVARETATLDRLAGGRLTLGVGLGSDRFGGELSKTAEEQDDRRRAQMLDESLEILTAAWSGDPVTHHGEQSVKARACPLDSWPEPDHLNHRHRRRPGIRERPAGRRSFLVPGKIQWSARDLQNKRS